MPVWSLDDIVGQTAGTLLRGNPQLTLRAVSTDSRQVPADALFVALRGEHFDGHDFVAVAVRNGAAAVLVSDREVLSAIPDATAGVIYVPDTLVALQALARAQRAQFRGTVVAITGSNGKTTVKEMAAAVLQQRLTTFRSPGNLNNHIGLPLSWLQMPANTEVAVYEMGMNHLGEIEQLCTIAQPHIGVVTNVALAHVGYLGSLELIQQAKGELIESLDAAGIAIVNGDDPLTAALGERAAGRVLTFGTSETATVQGRLSQDHGLHGIECEVEIDGKSWTVQLGIPGVHNITNMLAAAAVGVALNMPAVDIVAGLQSYRGMYGRMAVRQGKSEVTVIDDSYNANPASMRAALQVLAQVPKAGRRVAVLGDMLELGDTASTFHHDIGVYAAECGVDHLITLGPLSRAMAVGAREAGMAASRIYCAAEPTEVLEALTHLLRARDVVMIKGSRGMAMEHLVTALVDETGSA